MIPPHSPADDDPAADVEPAADSLPSVAEHELWPPGVGVILDGAPEVDDAPAPAVEVVEHGAPPAWAVEAAPAEESVDTAEALGPLSADRLRSVIESLLFASERPLTVQRIVELLEELAAAPRDASGPPLYQPAQIQDALAQLEIELRAGERGIELHQVAGGWQLRTAAQNAAWVQRLLQAKPVRLSRAQLETMAIVAYRQPVTRPEIDDIRGVDSGGALKTLLDRQMVRVLGKKEEPGRPLLYGTTRDFLEFFNLRDLKDLPTLREYHELTDENREKMRSLGHEPPVPGEVIQDPLLPPPVEPTEGATPATVAASDADGPPAPAPPADVDAATATAATFFPRRELIDQQLADDAEQLAKIDEMIRAVNIAFPLLDPTLDPSLAPAAPPADAKTPDAAVDDEAERDAAPEAEGSADREPEEL